jgi:hypothetical protein
MHSKVVHFKKKQESTKVHSIVLNFWIFFYHGFNCNAIHVSKNNKVHINRSPPTYFNIYTSRKKNWNLKKRNNYVKDLWKYGSILTIQKSLIKIWLWFLKEDFHIKVYYLMLHHILSHYISFGMKFNMNLFIFYHFGLLTNPYFCTSKVHCEKWMYFYWKINYIIIFIIKLIMYIQFQKIQFDKFYYLL